MRRPRVEPDGRYVVDDHALPVGSTLGGPDLCVFLKANGHIAAVHSLAAGTNLFSGVGIRHWDRDSGMHLEPRRGRFVLQPYAQKHIYRLNQDVRAEERVWVLDAKREAPAVCYVSVRLRNVGTRTRRLASVIFARLAARMTGDDVEARFDEEQRGLVVWNHAGRPCARAIALSVAPASWGVTSDHSRTVADRWSGPFPGKVDAAGSDPLGALHVDVELPPNSAASYEIMIVALPEGPGTLASVLRSCPAGAEALRATRERYDAALDRGTVVTPRGEVDLGVRWAKANMLRVIRHTPTGPGFTNDPGRSNACVARDAAWFVHGCDWLEPEFSLALLRSFAARQEDDGKIVEWFDLRSGETYDDGLDVNDNTPLFVLAVWHHVVATGDRAALAELYPAAARAGAQLLAHRDERGLVRCSATGTGARGIVGWRNIIEGYRLSGATTELNSEAHEAFRRLGQLAEALGRDDDASRWAQAGNALHAAIQRHLRNEENGLYHLAIDIDGRVRSEVTSDLVFPVIFNLSDEATSERIVARLRESDFWTSAGIRTVSRDAPEYGPTHGHGLLGGVWVAVTFWYAFAAAKFFPDIMAEALESSFAHYARDPLATNTVPGEFSEWLHGETLANQGMMLSPWFPPRYVWAAIEGACGLEPRIDSIRIAPNIPAHWNWVAARNVPLHGAPFSWIVVRDGRQLRLLATRAVTSDLDVETYERDVTSQVHVEGEHVAVVALQSDERVVVFLGNRESHTITAAIRREGAVAERNVTRRYDRLRGVWCQEEFQGEAFPLTLARGGYALVEFV